MNYILSDRRNPLLTGILLCKSQELSRREHSTSQLCSIHHDIPVTMHTRAAYGQLSVFGHSGDNQSAVLGTRYGIWWPWYGQFEVGWLQPHQFWLGAGTSSVVPVLVSQNTDLCHVQLHVHPTLGLNQFLNVGVDQLFHICIVDTCQWVYIHVFSVYMLKWSSQNDGKLRDFYRIIMNWLASWKSLNHIHNMTIIYIYICSQ